LRNFEKRKAEGKDFNTRKDQFDMTRNEKMAPILKLKIQ
jgi:hypothetical protein